MHKPVKYLFLALLLVNSGFSAAYEVDPNRCPSEKQKILVIDLKSGWWAGDGGDFGKELMTRWQEACPNRIAFEYQHRTFGNGGYPGGGFGGGGFGFGDFAPKPPSEPQDDGKFPKDDWATYSQIWLLSGGEADSIDLRIETALWKRYRDGIVGSEANVFIGGSFGNIYHANALTAELGLGQAFVTDRQAHEYPTPASGVEGKSQLTKGQELREHPLFADVDAIVDDLQVGQYLMVSDALNVGTPGLEVIGSNTKGAPSIGVLAFQNRKFVFDAGVHRFYGILNRQEQTLRYLQNISLFLAR